MTGKDDQVFAEAARLTPTLSPLSRRTPSLFLQLKSLQDYLHLSERRVFKLDVPALFVPRLLLGGPYERHVLRGIEPEVGAGFYLDQERELAAWTVAGVSYIRLGRPRGHKEGGVKIK